MTSRRATAGQPALIKGTVYQLHLDPPLGHAKHYTGWTRDLDARLADHEAGQGARLTQVQLERGGSWRLARAEPGTRDRENQLKERGASRDCPICRTERAEHDKEAGECPGPTQMRPWRTGQHGCPLSTPTTARRSRTS